MTGFILYVSRYLILYELEILMEEIVLLFDEGVLKKE